MRNILSVWIGLLSSSLAPLAHAHQPKAPSSKATYYGTVLAIHEEHEAPDYVVEGYIDVQLMLPDGNIENSVFETLLFPCRPRVGERFQLHVDRSGNETRIVCEPTNG